MVCIRGWGLLLTHQTVTLAAVHHTVKNIQDPEPEGKHARSVWQLVKESQEDLADQGCGLEASLCHANGVGMVDLRLQKEDYKRE